MGANFGWSYPPGVTGREYAIAGPDWEEEAGVCPGCGKEALLAQGYGEMVLICCSECDHEVQSDLKDYEG